MVRAPLKPSRLLAAALTLVHAAAAATVFPLQLAIAAKGALIALVIASLVHSLRHHALRRSGSAVVELEIRDRAHAAIRTRSADWRDARIVCTSCVTPTLTVLNLRVEGSRFPRHALLVRDNVSADHFRRIRVLLRWARPKPAGKPRETADRP